MKVARPGSGSSKSRVFCVLLRGLSRFDDVVRWIDAGFRPMEILDPNVSGVS